MQDDTRSRILLAAAEIFAEKGFEATTIREICDAAGANLAGVNYHFGDKEKLYLESVRLAHELKILQVPQCEWLPSTPPEEKLRLFISMLLRRMVGIQEAPWQMRLMMKEMLNPTNACRVFVEDFIKPEFEQLQLILDELLPTETPDPVRHQIGFSIVGQCLHYRIAAEVVAILISDQEREMYFQVEQLIEHVTTFSLAAIREWSTKANEQDHPLESSP